MIFMLALSCMYNYPQISSQDYCLSYTGKKVWLFFYLVKLVRNLVFVELDLTEKMTKIYVIGNEGYMRLVEKLKEFENQYMFIRWATGGEYGKLVYAGDDFIEFDVINVDTMEYSETVLIHSPLILEVCIGGSDVARILAEMSSKISME